MRPFVSAPYRRSITQRTAREATAVSISAPIGETSSRQKLFPSSRSHRSSHSRPEKLSPAKRICGLPCRSRVGPSSRLSPAFAACMALHEPSTTSVSAFARTASAADRMAWSDRAVSESGWPSQPRYCGKPGLLLRRCRCASKSSFSRLSRSGSDTQLQIFESSTLIIKAPSSGECFPFQAASRPAYGRLRRFLTALPDGAECILRPRRCAARHARRPTDRAARPAQWSRASGSPQTAYSLRRSADFPL